MSQNPVVVEPRGLFAWIEEDSSFNLFQLALEKLLRHSIGDDLLSYIRLQVSFSQSLRVLLMDEFSAEVVGREVERIRFDLLVGEVDLLVCN